MDYSLRLISPPFLDYISTHTAALLPAHQFFYSSLLFSPFCINTKLIRGGGVRVHLVISLWRSGELCNNYPLAGLHPMPLSPASRKASKGGWVPVAPSPPFLPSILPSSAVDQLNIISPFAPSSPHLTSANDGDAAGRSALLCISMKCLSGPPAPTTQYPHQPGPWPRAKQGAKFNFLPDIVTPDPLHPWQQSPLYPPARALSISARVPRFPYPVEPTCTHMQTHTHALVVPLLPTLEIASAGQ